MNINSIKNTNCYIVDFSYILYRSYYSLKNFSVDMGGGLKRPVGHIVGVLSTITNLVDYDENAIIFLCLDGHPRERQMLCESIGIGYKAGRTKPEYNIKADIGIICDLLMHIPNVYVVENDDAESDDLMFALSRHLDTSNKCYLYTRDMDLLQSLNDNTFIISGWENNSPIIIDETFYNNDEKLYKKFRACPPSKLPFYRALVGDSSDNLKGVYRMNKDFAKSIAMEINNISEIDEAISYFNHLANTPSKKGVLTSIQTEDNQKIKVNYAIMRLHDKWEYTITRDLTSIKGTLTSLKLNRFKQWLTSHHISIL